MELLKEKLGFDDAFNYREESDLKSTLRRLFLVLTYLQSLGKKNSDKEHGRLTNVA